MWLFYAFGSAFFAGVTAILAKCGIRNTDSTAATAIRTIVILLFAWLMVFLVGSQGTIPEITAKTFLFLILSGLATGGSWLCYFRALQIGDVNKVVPVDKTSIILTVILAFLILGETVTFVKIVGLVGIGAGTFLMIKKKKSAVPGNAVEGNASGKQKASAHAWFFYAAGSALFAALTSIFGKIGIENVESNLGTAIRTAVVLLMAWMMVFITGKRKKLRGIPGKELIFILLSGLATGASWLCYYRALQEGDASTVVPVSKLSVPITIFFAFLVFREKLSVRSMLGLALIIFGTMLMVDPFVAECVRIMNLMFS